MSIAFGTSYGNLTGINYTISNDKGSTTELKKAYNNNGKCIEQVAHSITKTITTETYNDGVTATAGNTVTSGGDVMQVTSATIRESNTDFGKLSVSAEKSDASVFFKTGA